MEAIVDAMRTEARTEAEAEVWAAVVAKAWTDVRDAVKAEARDAAEAEVRAEAIAEARTEARAALFKAKHFLELLTEIRAAVEAEVEKEVKVELLTLQLEHRFGDLPEEMRRKIRTAVESQLGRWLVNVLDAPTLEAAINNRHDAD